MVVDEPETRGRRPEAGDHQLAIRNSQLAFSSLSRRRHLHLFSLSHGASARPHAGDEFGVAAVLYIVSLARAGGKQPAKALGAQRVASRSFPGLNRSV